MPRILQLTDLHLFADPNERLKNVPTWATFRDVCEHIRANAATWDLLVITQRFPESAKHLEKRWFSRMVS